MMAHNHIDQMINVKERTEYIAAVMGYYRYMDEIEEVRESSAVEIKWLEERNRRAEERLEMEKDVHEEYKKQLAKVSRDWFAMQSLCRRLLR